MADKMADKDDLSTGAVFSGAWADGKQTWQQLLVTDIAYKLLAFALLTPLFGFAVRAGISLSGSSVLADQEIALFFLRPVGMAVMIGMVALSLSILALQQACLMAIGVGAAEGAAVSVMGALRFVLEQARQVIGLAIRLVARCLLYAAPFVVGLGLVYLSLLREYDINYYLMEKPPAFLLALGLAAVLAAGLVWVLVPRLIGWGLALPLVLFEGVPPNQALAESTRRVAGHRPAFAKVLLLWGAGAVMLILAVPPVIFAIGRLVAPFGKGHVNLVLILMVLLGTFWLLANLLVTWVNDSAFALLIVRLYEQFGGGRGEILSRLSDSQSLDDVQQVRLTLGRLLAGLLVFALAAAGIGYYFLQNVKGNNEVTIIAHRGAAGAAPENTMASVSRAIEDGTDFVEIDVQETVDGEIAVIHDSDFMKVSGIDLKIWDATWEDLEEIDVGSWFGAEFTAERVPHLRDVLEASRDKAIVTIELKYYGHDENLEQRVIDLVEELDMVDQVVVMSLKYEAIQKVRQLRPDWTLGLLTATAIGDLTDVDADFLAVATSLASRSFVKRAQKKGKQVYVWTINDPVQMFRMMNFGVDGIITDEPALAREVMERRARLSTAQRLLVGIAFYFGASAQDPPVTEDTE